MLENILIIAGVMLVLLGVLTWVFWDAIVDFVVDKYADKFLDDYWLYGPDDEDSH